MRFGANGEAALDLQVEQDLVSVPGVAEIAERRPLQTFFRAGAEIAFEKQLSVPGADRQFMS